MDPSHMPMFRRAVPNAVPQRQHHQPYHQSRRPPTIKHEDSQDGDENRIAHTLTACCRCRLRKTRCDPTLPRCLPCERAGATCEYLDTAKGRKINRFYVIKLQEKVKALEAELGPYIDSDDDDQQRQDDKLPSADLVRLSASEGSNRYLGPSSGIVMTRLLVDEAKRFTESSQISDLMSELRVKRQARMQSVQMSGMANMRSRKKSYPMLSESPAENLPNRNVANKLVEIFTQRAQLFSPILHENTFREDLDAVYDGDTDPYKNFVVRMVIAISLQKLGSNYAGLADGYYLAAMQHFEDVVRPKDLKTLQCLVLTGQYSFLTPTRSSAYYVVGLAAKICQRMGLTDEQTIAASGLPLNPLLIDLRRRLVWITISMEYELAHSMGRPSGFATGHDLIDVGFFSTMSDDNITEQGIQNGPPDNRKLMAIHMCRMNLLQAEISRTLYEKKSPEPKNETHPWYQIIEKKIAKWLDDSPSDEEWCKAWVTGWYHQLRIFLYRPTPQVPQPSPTAAKTCFESSAHVIRLSRRQFDGNLIDISWLFILALTTSLNTLLWTLAFPEVRALHPKEDVEELVDIALGVLEQSAERWPGAQSSSQMYAVFAKACMQSYNPRANTGPQPGSWTVPPIIYEPSASPDAKPQTGSPSMNPPQFGNVFNSPSESMENYTFDPNFPTHPTFRSNSIFQAPASTDSTGRRFSYFPPDFTQMDDVGPSANSNATYMEPPQHLPQQHQPQQQQQPHYHAQMHQPNMMASPPEQHLPNMIPTTPESLDRSNMSSAASTSTTLSPNILPDHAPNMISANTAHNYPMDNSHHQHQQQQPHFAPRVQTYTMSPAGPSTIQQRPLPSTDDWLINTAPFISSDGLAGMTNTFFGHGSNDNSSSFSDFSHSGLGMSGMGGGGNAFAFTPQAMNLKLDYGLDRQGSLTHQQQLELMNVLETEGLGDIDTMLSAGSMTDVKWFP